MFTDTNGTGLLDLDATIDGALNIVGSASVSIAYLQLQEKTYVLLYRGLLTPGKKLFLRSAYLALAFPGSYFFFPFVVCHSSH